MNAVVLQDVRFSYAQTEVLHGVSASLQTGKLHGLFGPNGSGKTTLLKCLANLLPCTGIQVQGQELARLSGRERARMVSYVPQEHKLSFPFTVEELVLMGRTPHIGGGMSPSRTDRERAAAAIHEIGIETLAHRPYTELSGGQRQLTLLTRALAQDADVMVLDEPTSALDFKNQMLVWNKLRALCDRGKTIIVCTHDPNHLLWFCDDALILKKGTLIGAGDARELIDGQVLTQLYGDVCGLEHGMIRPNLRFGS